MNAQLYTFFSESMQFEDRFFPGTNPLDPDFDFSLLITDRGLPNSTRQAFQLTVDPQWLTTAQYVTNQRVEFSGINYVATTNPLVGAQPPIDPLQWTPIGNGVPPDWSATGVYAPGDQVFFDFQYYVCTVAVGPSVVTPPNDAGHWMLDPSLICYVMTQDYQSTYRWLQVSRYVLVGNTLTNVPEFTPAVNGGFNQTSYPYLIDFAPDTTSSSDSNGIGAGNILYVPSAEYRRIELQGDTPLKNINISVFALTTFGLLLPIYLGPGGSFDAELLFERKGHGSLE
jgi:hypothetical protein